MSVLQLGRGGLEYRTEGCLINGAQGPVVCSHAIPMLEMRENAKLILVGVLSLFCWG